MFARLSEYPEFADKIRLFVGIAPVAAVANSTAELLHIGAESHLLDVMSFVHIWEFLPYGF